jgi:hypothetical protein
MLSDLYELERLSCGEIADFIEGLERQYDRDQCPAAEAVREPAQVA